MELHRAAPLHGPVQYCAKKLAQAQGQGLCQCRGGAPSVGTEEILLSVPAHRVPTACVGCSEGDG